jgi:endoglucanase
MISTGTCKATTLGSGSAKSWGRLTVKGTQIVNSKGQKVRLKGVSTHGIAWFPQYVNKNQFASWKRFGCNTIRIAMYTSKSEGYTTKLYSKVDEGVKYATELGMYVIIDWHILKEGNPNTGYKKANAFFTRMAKKYKNQSNVLYEICNEPNGNVTWSKQIKPYATKIIKTIRKYDKKSIVIVGTPTWSQDVDEVAKSPIKGQKNIMYALHFYAATHTDWNRSKLVTAHNKGLPVFVSEFSICDASGNGSNNYSEAGKWMSLLKKYSMSYITWSVCNKNETCSLIRSSCQKTGTINTNDLSATGKWFIKQIKK